MEKETLEEAAEKHCDIHEKLKGQKYKWSAQDRVLYNTFIDGAKWQAERMYSEKEVQELLIKALTYKDNGDVGNLVTIQNEIRTANFYNWFEQFKKK